MSTMTLWGFDGSTYVRTVKMLFAEKKFTDFEQVPLNVLSGEHQLGSPRATNTAPLLPIDAPGSRQSR